MRLLGELTQEFTSQSLLEGGHAAHYHTRQIVYILSLHSRSFTFIVHDVPQFLKSEYVLHVLEVDGVLVDVLEHLVVLEIHPSQMTSAHAQCVSAHVFQVDHGFRLGATVGSEACLQFGVALEHPLEGDQQLQDAVLVTHRDQYGPVVVHQHFLQLESELFLRQELEALGLFVLEHLGRKVPVGDEYVCVLELVELQRDGDVLGDVVDVHGIHYDLFVVLDLPASASDRVPSRQRRQYDFGLSVTFAATHSAVLVEGDQFDLFEDLLHVLQREGSEVVDAFLLDEVLVHGQCAHLGSGRRADHFQLWVLGQVVSVQVGQCAHVRERRMRQEYVVKTGHVVK